MTIPDKDMIKTYKLHSDLIINLLNELRDDLESPTKGRQSLPMATKFLLLWLLWQEFHSLSGPNFRTMNSAQSFQSDLMSCALMQLFLIADLHKFSSIYLYV